MKKFKHVFTIFCAFTFGVVSLAPVHANFTKLGDQQYSTGYHSVLYEETSTLKHLFPVLTAAKNQDIFLCSSTSDPNCSSAYRYDYTSILKVCSNSSEMDCIESLSSVDETGVENPGDFLKYIVDNHVNNFPADPVNKIPSGSATPSIWNLKSAPHPGGIQYAVIAGEEGQINSSTHTGNRTLTVSVVPVAYENHPSSYDYTWGPNVYDSCRQIDQIRGKNIECNHELGTWCYLNTTEKYWCYAQKEMPRNLKLRISLRLSNEPTGWLHGRMEDPSIQINKFANNGTQLIVTANSTQVPTVFQEALWTNLPGGMQNFWVACMTSDISCGMVSTHNDDMNYYLKAGTVEGNASLNLEAQMFPFGNVALDGIKELAPLVDDKAVAFQDAWSFRTLSANEMSGSNSCFTSGSGLKGIVTTNSTTYSAGPPELKDGTLNYKVASLHYNSDGSVFRGTYNMVVRSDVARCLYKFSNAPIKASIEVVSEAGDASNVATTVANEKDGWLYLSANNFTFSAPTVKVKLSQDSQVATPSTPMVAPSSKPITNPNPKIATITCMKGKTVKKISAIKPVCPKGYVKK